MKRYSLIIMLALLAGVACAWDVTKKYSGPKSVTTDTSWHADILPGYEARYVNQGEAFDGPCRSTIVRIMRKPGSHHSGMDATATGRATAVGRSAECKRGFLYVHGFNDYFFQSEMGERFVDSGYHFYAVDLRRYGRSYEPWQYPFNIRDQKEYFADIDSALSQMRRDGITDITLGGHSTGGLTVTLYAVCHAAGENGVYRVVTDSPFLAWNFNSFYRNFLIPSVSAWSRLFPDTKIKQSACDGYAYSLLREYHGEWTYDTDWKMIYSPPVTSSWTGSIQRAQKEVLKKADRLQMPLLVMHSSRKIEGCGWTPEFQTGDAVLDPAMLQERGERIKAAANAPVQVCAIDSGLHDLILSRREIRDAAYDTMFRFMRQFL